MVPSVAQCQLLAELRIISVKVPFLSKLAHKTPTNVLAGERNTFGAGTQPPSQLANPLQAFAYQAFQRAGGGQWPPKLHRFRHARWT